MKLTTVLLLAVMLQAAAKSNAQTITYAAKSVSLEKVFVIIKQQTGYVFFYREEDLAGLPAISVSFRNTPLATVLQETLKGQPLQYSIQGKTIFITTAGAVHKRKDIVQEEMISEALTREITGVVRDGKGEPLEGVSVTIKGARSGATTNADGRFRLSIPSADNTELIFSFVGYATKTIKAGSLTEFNIVMEEAASNLSDVVVVGYGTQKKAKLTGAVVSVSGKELTKTPAISLTNSFTGLLPGMITKNVSGEPGRDDASILIRGRNTTGNNNVLVVVDGIQDASGWQYINPNDIESVSVLKDASAAIYGARAANGVILITTKRGISGKPTISYTFNQGINQPTRIPEMANSATLAGYFNEMLIKRGQPARYTDEEIKKFEDGSDPLNYPNVNWFDETLKKNSWQSQHNLSIRGGSNNVKYLISGSYSNQGSIFKDGSANFKTYSIRSNLDAQVSKSIKVSLDVNGGIDDGNYPAFSTKKVFMALNNNLPFTPVIYPNGLPSAGVERGENPILMASDATGNYNHTAQYFSAKASFDIDIPWINGLGVDGYFNYRNVMAVDKNWEKPWTAYNYDKSTDTYIPVSGGGIVSPQLTQGLESDKNNLINLRVKYEKQFNSHYLNAFVAFEQSKGALSNFTAFRKAFISDQLDELFAGGLVNQEANGSSSEEGRKNFFGRIHYDYQGKYLVDFNYRYDGSSNFPQGKRYGFFPGLSAAWKISEEKFISNRFDFIDNLKLRASAGQLGNDQIDPFQFLRLYKLTNSGYNFGQPPISALGLTAGVTPNPNITWEVATVTNIGLDGSFLNGLLGFSVDLFKQRRSNILATRSLAIPSFTGLSLPNENIGIVENKGFEIELSHAKTIERFVYRIAGNLAYARNKVIDISEASNVPEWQKAEGHSIDASKYYLSAGIVRTQEELDKIPVYVGTQVGDLKYEDLNGDGNIDAADMVRLDKTSIPQITYGFNLSLSYGAFSLFANFTGAAKVWQPFRFQALLGYNVLQDLLDNRYTDGSMDSKYPTLPLQSGVNALSSTFWLYNTSFVRLKTLELGYDLPEALLSKAGIRAAKIYVNGSNLLTFSKMKLFDPETNDLDGFFYPQNKIYNIGINIAF